MLKDKINLLLVEDSEDDEILALRAIKNGGLDVTHLRVQTAEEYIRALEADKWNIIISDYVLPNFSGTDALDILRRSGSDIPFIVVSGKIGEDIAVELIKAGANDYIIKSGIKRLPHAIEREIREALVRSQKREADIKLKELVEELKIARDKAESASSSKSRFLATMSHELRTPLNGIIGFANILALIELTREQTIEMAEFIKACGNNLLDIITSILDYSNLEAEKVEPKKTPFKLNDLIWEVIKNHATEASRKNIEISYVNNNKYEEILLGDRDMFRSILSNLIGNSIKFTEKGKVEIINSADYQAEGTADIRISVRDEGIGITSEDIKNIFTPFFQADSSTTRKYNGIGLGLAIANLLIKLMGGKLVLEGMPQKGSCFYFTVRIPKAGKTFKNIPVQQSSELTGDQTPVSDKKNYKILAVDDVPMNLILISRMLKNKGHSVILAESGKIAIEKCKTENPDFILMDINMPVMDGIMTTHQIRKEGFNMPIIALSGDRSAAELKKSIQSGMNGYLTKPFKLDELISLIEKNMCKCENPESVKISGPAASEEKTENLKAIFNYEEFCKTSENNLQTVAEIIKLFMESSEKFIDDLKSAVDKGSLTKINFFAQRLKGMALNVYAEALAAALEELQKFTEGENPGKDKEQLCGSVLAEYNKLKTKLAEMKII